MRVSPLNEHRLQATPNNAAEWLMQPNAQEPVVGTHNEVVEAALDSMPETLQEVLRAVFFEQVPYSALGERLGCSKTQAWRKAQAGIAMLKTILKHDPTILERYGMHANWNDAADAIIQSYDRVLPRAALIDVIDFCGREMAHCVREGTALQSFMFNSIAMEAVAELKEQGHWQSGNFLRLLCSKQADYGHENINMFGLTGVAVRIHDKIARLKNLSGKEALNEPLLDTWFDLVGYCTIAEMLFSNTFNLQLKDNQ